MCSRDEGWCHPGLGQPCPRTLCPVPRLGGDWFWSPSEPHADRDPVRCGPECVAQFTTWTSPGACVARTVTTVGGAWSIEHLKAVAPASPSPAPRASVADAPPARADRTPAGGDIMEPTSAITARKARPTGRFTPGTPAVGTRSRARCRAVRALGVYAPVSPCPTRSGRTP